VLEGLIVETREFMKANKEAMEFCLEKMVATQENLEVKMDV
jgi:hypothetical protein